MKLVLAQGNPEAKYTDTRHNIGFTVIENFANEHSAEWSEKPKFHSLIAETTLEGEKILLVKPTTYYNETGLAARTLADFYKVTTDDILVIHDDLALPFGTIRVRSKGSDAGNNGIKSLNAHLGDSYRRIRIGIWNEQRNHMDDVNFVLGKLSIEEKSRLVTIGKEVSQLIHAFVRNELDDHSFSLPID